MDSVKIFSKKELDVLYNKITALVNDNFNKLITIHKKILVKYLYKLVVLFGVYFYTDNFIEQLYLNKYQDIFSLLVLLMPYYDLNKSKIIITLDELFLNKDLGAKRLESSYYIDHLDLNLESEPDYLKKYFNSALLCVENTLSQIHCLILPNWCNIFPHTMETYKNSNIYKNLEYLYKEKKFVYSNLVNQLISTDKHTDFDFESETKFILGYPILYGTIYSFLYMDIKSIKWMIYDLNIENKTILPNIIYLGNKLGINPIVNKPWEKLSGKEKENVNDLWKDFIQSNKTNQISLRSLVLFYLRWEKDNNELNNLGFSKKCLEQIKTNLDNVYEEKNEFSKNGTSNEVDDRVELNIFDDSNLDNCLKKIYSKIKLENIYNYIYNCLHKFRYTWYGYCCLDENNNILSEDNYFKKYFLINSVHLNINPTDNKKYYYITPKNIYNFCKALIHFKTPDNKYICLSLEPKWNNVNTINQKRFIVRIKDVSKMNIWFNINRNIKKSYPEITNTQIQNIMNKYIEILTNTSLFVNVIFQTLVYNGMLSFYKYNPKMTDSSIIPNKNTQYKQWESYVLTNIDIKSYTKSYHAFSNTMLEAHGSKTIETMVNSKWYTNFGANWIAQIQLYHHYIHNRVMFITGATGAGKSTLSPFLLVYAVKILNYNNNAKVVCTQPRTQPVKDNSEQISKNIGIPITIKKNKDLDSTDELYRKTTIGEAIKQDINYIQYKHKNGNLTDDLYHPYLRLYTDGSLYNIIKQNYFFKKTIGFNPDSNPDSNPDTNVQEYLPTNIFDIILVDEAHEHNTYMDMILTLSKFGIYINNQITLGIISATMDNDEQIYRKYFQPIDDNWKAPLNIFEYDVHKNDELNIKNKFIPNVNIIDRRIHLSIPFGGMNFEVKEYPNETVNYPASVDTFTDMKKINNKVIDIVKYILANSPKGDILIFQPGEADIKKLVTEINKQTSSNVIAIPFYSKLDNEILENIVKKIDKEETRNKIRYPKNKYDITQIFKIPQNELVPPGTYNRFIIIATNIAEASITIDSLEFVIDTGNQKISVYDPDTNQGNLETRQIAIPNQKQRKGRVGRVKPGFAYYTYDRTKLGEKVVYKMNIENINSFILDLVTVSDTKFINENSDPYKVNDYGNIKECLQNQYIYLSYDNFNGTFETVLFNNRIGLRDVSNIIYPYSDGKFKLETLEDNDGTFFIIHPGEDYFERNPETLKITNIKSNYFNKITKAFEYGKSHDIIGNNNLLTPYGTLINSIVDFTEISDNPIDFTRIILDCFSFGLDIDSDVFKNILMFITFKTTVLNFKVSNYLLGKADYLIYCSIIDENFYHEINFKKDILDYLDPELKKLKELVDINVRKLVDDKLYGKIKNSIVSGYGKLDSNIEEIKKALSSFYMLKFKIDIMILNSKYALKKNFLALVENLTKQKQNKKLSNEYLIFVNKFILYLSNSPELIKKNVINNLILELKNTIPDTKTNVSGKIANETIGKIKKIFESGSIFENESLPKINLYLNKKYSKNITNQFEKLSNYDKLCFIIGKNFPQNIVIKVPETEFYVDYYKKDINRIYSLEKNMFKINDKKTITYTLTKVPEDIRNFNIFAVGMNDYFDLNNIMVLSELLVSTLNNYFESINFNLFTKNLNFNEELSKEIYQDDKYNNVMKKIDKIIKYIKDN